ncbi:30S ribosomal protein S2 [Brumimicrobium oceani]|uniref:Small ribosomal subunit protein uS2 n=1 Tax=Brumimicrobium oceani TaxID=2100725 RepID=A0A2U2X1B2_9FLAO|nr:30S ribosomal protein S2 [Brumimicrobium oceani]PWH81571.1 30S ribosomal protein S2 [Brumimicrobium oceani]
MSKKADFKELLDAGVHFGHLKRKWNPAMAPYIFDEQKGIHVIDLNKTIAHLEQACLAMKQIAKSGKKILFVATKKQAKQIVADRVKAINMPYVTERWTGGMLTNFATTRKSVRKMATIDKMQSDGTWDTLSKREKLFITRQREKLEKNFGSIADMTRQPAAIFIVDVMKENIALKEAVRLGITTFAMIDTNSNPKLVDFPIPANDDASKSVAIIMDYVTAAIQEGLEERKTAKSKQEADKKAEETKKKEDKKKADEEKAAKKEASKKEEETKVEDKSEAKTEVKAEDKSE